MGAGLSRLTPLLIVCSPQTRVGRTLVSRLLLDFFLMEDRLITPDGTAKVVDLAPASFQQFFSVMAQIDFVDQARRRGIEPIALFMAAPDAVSQRAYAELQRGLPELLLVPVYNEAIAQGK